MIAFAPYPIPVTTPLGDAYLIYVQSSEMFEYDVWTCCLCEGGDVKHFSTDQINIFKNATFNIYEKEISKETKEDGSNSNPEQTARHKESL